MPRYSSLIVKDVKILSENTQSVFSDYKTNFNFEGQDSSELSNDIRLNWDGSLDYDNVNQDFKLVYNVEAFVQSLYFFLITQRGRFPGDSSFGWDLEDVITSNSFTLNLKTVVDNLYQALQEHPDIEFIEDIVVQLFEDDQTSYLKINLSVKPKFFTYNIFLDFELY